MVESKLDLTLDQWQHLPVPEVPPSTYDSIPLFHYNINISCQPHNSLYEANFFIKAFVLNALICHKVFTHILKPRRTLWLCTIARLQMTSLLQALQLMLLPTLITSLWKSISKLTCYAGRHGHGNHPTLPKTDMPAMDNFISAVARHQHFRIWPISLES